MSAYYLKRGYTSDPECHRTSHRLRVARGILAEQGITSRVDHFQRCIEDRQSLKWGGCWSQCKTVWIDTSGVEVDNLVVFENAWNEACAIQDERSRLRDVARNEQLKTQRT